MMTLIYRSVPLAAPVVLLALVLALSPADPAGAGATTITVDTTSDANLTACTAAAADCSLRGAINAATPNDTIAFNIDVNECFVGICGITPDTELPPIADNGLTINGYTQPSATPNTAGPGQPTNTALKIVINGDDCPGSCEGLTINADGVTIKGLDILLWGGDGIRVSDADDAAIEGNYIGINAFGFLTTGNNVGVRVGGGTGNRIGGTSNGARNVISGNQDGIVIVPSKVSPAADNLIQGNIIGLNPAGSAAIANTSRGIYIIESSDNTIGGTTPGARNVISGQGADGIAIIGTSPGNDVRGNYIGTDVTGMTGVGNGAGVVISGAVGGNVIGGTSAGARNVISGNTFDGVAILQTNGQTVMGNFIGTDAAGTAAVPNGDAGVRIEDAQGNTIGGDTPGERNVISGNTSHGVSLPGTGNVVEGNFIGTNAAGTSAVPNEGSGVVVFGSENIIGGSSPAMGNVISGNLRSGLRIEGEGNELRNNLVGISGDGGPLGNNTGGIQILFANGNAVTENSIAHNGAAALPDNRAGIRIRGGTGNLLQANNIHSNADLGIDLTESDGSDAGVSPNDPGDGDTGGNNTQNFPELTSALAGSLAVTGSLDSAPSTEFRLEFFANDACDDSGNGEGQTFLGSTDLTLDADGVTEFAANIDADPEPGDFLTSTATNLTTNDTSEFSACIEIEAAPTTPTPIPTDTPEPTPPPTGPTSTATPTPGPTGTATATPTPGPTGKTKLTQGDVDCDEDVDSVDALFELRDVAALPVNQPPGCPEIGGALARGLSGQGASIFGDVDCDDDVDSVDALFILRHVAALPVNQPKGCPEIGGPL